MQIGGVLTDNVHSGRWESHEDQTGRERLNHKFIRRVEERMSLETSSANGSNVDL